LLVSEPVLLNNRYQLTDRLGSGGMAVVYRAYDQRLERTVAIKILRKNLSNDPAFRERFRQEAKAAASLSHPNIVTVHDFGSDTEQTFIVMEYVPGKDLKTIFETSGRLPVELALLLTTQACAGIGFAHRSGLVHCDVKPQNMLVTPENRLKVVDFGIARAMGSIRPDEKHEVVWGSPQYFSPEMASGSPPSPASDIYSLGVILFEALTGQLPFTAASAEELVRMHREMLPPSPRQLDPTIPVSLERILLKTLSKNPLDRYRTADELESVLKEQSKILDQSYPDPPSQTNWVDEYLPDTTIEPFLELIPDQASFIEAESPSYKQAVPQTTHPQTQFDWITWLLALFALLIVGGLIPFWLWIVLLINSPF
jgi:eukaryotic-like serine/threonine-protein kinase